MMLGEFRFSIDTAAPDSSSRNSSWRFGSHEIVGADPVLQFGGANSTTRTYSGTIYPHYAGGLGQVDKMIELADTGKELMLLTGYGKSLGKYVIESVLDNETKFAKGGIPKQIDFTIGLKRASR
jgi:phage protein U